jgi:hypothetical protein
VAFSVTVSKKTSSSGEEKSALCSGQKSFISIHSTDHLCQVVDIKNPANLEECNVEVLSLNEVFPSTSEESLSNDDDTPVQRKHRNKNKSTIPKCQSENAAKSGYVPTNSKSSTLSGRQKDVVEGQASGYSDFDIPKSTMYVIGSNPGEPKMSYPDPPKKISKTVGFFIFHHLLTFNFPLPTGRTDISNNNYIDFYRFSRVHCWTSIVHFRDFTT